MDTCDESLADFGKVDWDRAVPGQIQVNLPNAKRRGRPLSITLVLLEYLQLLDWTGR
jgi:hypothetical protein